MIALFMLYGYFGMDTEKCILKNNNKKHILSSYVTGHKAFSNLAMFTFTKIVHL